MTTADVRDKMTAVPRHGEHSIAVTRSAWFRTLAYMYDDDPYDDRSALHGHFRMWSHQRLVAHLAPSLRLQRPRPACAARSPWAREAGSGTGCADR